MTETINQNQTKTKLNMKDLLQEKEISFTLPKEGDVIEGLIIEKGRNKIFFDLGPIRTGVVYKPEIDLSLYDANSIKIGDTLAVKIIHLENEEGLVELSLREAGLDRVWEELKELKDKNEVFKVKIQEANRGGLVARTKGVQAFLPVSQLSPENYPHVEGGDKEEILKRLQDFAEKELEVKILDLDRKSNKVILSERAKASKETKEKLEKYSVGETVKGKVSGIVDFGVFITFDGIEGLVHISELGWQLVESPENIVDIGDEVEAKIIAIEDDKVSLSLKALKPNPWEEIADKYKVGDIIEGTVSKFNPFGAFIKIGDEIQGLAHISEFESYEDMTSALEIGKSYGFKITMLESKDYKMALQLLDSEDLKENSKSQVSNNKQDVEILDSKS